MTHVIEVVKMGIYGFWQVFVSLWLLRTLQAPNAKDLQGERSAFPTSKSIHFCNPLQNVSGPGCPISERVWDELESSLCVKNTHCPKWVQFSNSHSSHNNPMKLVLLFPLYMEGESLEEGKFREVLWQVSGSQDIESYHSLPVLDSS